MVARREMRDVRAGVRFLGWAEVLGSWLVVRARPRRSPGGRWRGRRCPLCVYSRSMDIRVRCGAVCCALLRRGGVV
jgi:hypothetical protein